MHQDRHRTELFGRVRVENSLCADHIPFHAACGRALFEDLRLPPEVYNWFRGPSFGASAVLERFGPSEAPLHIATLKLSVELSSTVKQLEDRIAEPLAGGFRSGQVLPAHWWFDANLSFSA
jgi:hypothetical protein